MKVLLDEDLPHKLRIMIPFHEVVMTAYCGWAGLKNGRLLEVAEEAGFEVFLTADKKLQSQQNLKTRRLAIIVLSEQEIDRIARHIVEVNDAVNRAVPYSLQVPDWPRL